MQFQTSQDFNIVIEKYKNAVQFFDLEKIKTEIALLQKELENPKIWNNQKEAQELSQNLKENKGKPPNLGTRVFTEYSIPCI